MKIIVNADDLGLSATVNNAIEKALCDKVITSSTILANSTLLTDVCRIVASYPQASFGVHLNLTQGPSLTRDVVLRRYGVIDEDGCFDKGMALKMCCEAPTDLKEAIGREWTAQIRLLRKAGIAPTHADGHHHCHIWVGLANLLAKVLSDENIPKARMRFYLPRLSAKQRLTSATSLFLWKVGLKMKSKQGSNALISSLQSLQSTIRYRHLLSVHGIATTDYFSPYAEFYNWKVEHSDYQSASVIELMCHPGHPSYTTEMDLVNHRILDAYGGIEYINYRDL